MSIGGFIPADNGYSPLSLFTIHHSLFTTDGSRLIAINPILSTFKTQTISYAGIV